MLWVKKVLSRVVYKGAKVIYQSIVHRIPDLLRIRTLPVWKRVAEAAGLGEVFGDLWSEKSIYVWTDLRFFDKSVHGEVLVFIQWLLYCK